jgi:BolA protein
MTRLERITDILQTSLAPSQLEVTDDSHKHAGHAGARPSGETHYSVVIESAALKGLSKIQMHQRIYALLDAELKNGLHALAIQASAPK